MEEQLNEKTNTPLPFVPLRRPLGPWPRVVVPLSVSPVPPSSSVSSPPVPPLPPGEIADLVTLAVPPAFVEDPVFVEGPILVGWWR